MSKNNDVSAIMDILSDYKDSTIEAMTEAVDKVTKEAVSELRSANPSGSGKYGSWKDYNKGWKSTKTSKKSTAHEKTIHNATHYRLTHLLEKGHAKVSGGRTRAFPHIEPVAEKVEEELLKEIEKSIKERS